MTHSDRTDVPSAQGTPSEYRSLASVWRALSRGELVVHSVSFQDENAVVVFAERSPEQAMTSALPGETRAVLERVLDGTSLKVIAAELDVSPSTVSTRLSSFAQKLGVPGRVAALPMILAQLRCAARVDSPMTGATYRFEDEDTRYVALVLPRADAELAQQLAPAEREVFRLFVEGFSHREIAQRRRTSVRTTANQVAAVYRRLKVSGRLELLARLASERIAGSETL